MLKDMGENIQHIPTEAFQRFKVRRQCIRATLVAATKRADIGLLLAKHLTGPQLKAIHVYCLQDFDFDNFEVPLAQFDHWHLVP